MQEQDILRNIVVPCEENPLPTREVEVDEFIFNYTASEKPHIQVASASENFGYNNLQDDKQNVTSAVAVHA